MHRQPFGKFIKASACGNELVFFMQPTCDMIGDSGSVLARFVADRKRGVGCDQMILCKDSDDHHELYVYNADGSRSAVCGNAFRCLGQILMQDTNTLKIVSNDLVFQCHKIGPEIWVNMGRPDSSWLGIPLTHDVKTIDVEFLGQKFVGIPIGVGNPHVTFQLDKTPDDFPLESFARAALATGLFPDGANVSIFFHHKNDPSTITARVFERGTGETQSCGSSACAVFSSIRSSANFPKDKLNIMFPGGELRVKSTQDGELLLSGDRCKIIFEGTLLTMPS